MGNEDWCPESDPTGIPQGPLLLFLGEQPELVFKDRYTETVVATIKFGIKQSQAPRVNAICRRWGPMVDVVDEELIANTYTKL